MDRRPSAVAPPHDGAEPALFRAAHATDTVAGLERARRRLEKSARFRSPCPRTANAGTRTWLHAAIVIAAVALARARWLQHTGAPAARELAAVANRLRTRTHP